MKKKFLLLPLAAALIYITLCSYETGAGATGGIDGTGATNAGGCSCHGTAAATTTVAIELDTVGGGVRTSYIAGGSYLIKITGTNTSITTLSHFGFQIAAISATGAGTTSAVDVGTLQSTGLPASCQFTPSGTYGGSFLPINVVEHSTPIVATTGTGGSGTTYVESIAWTAPTTAGAGTIKLYGAINAVNFDGTDGGDSWNNNNVSITEQIALAPITGTFTVCSGSTTPLSSTYTGGTWSIAPAFTASISATGVVTGLIPGNAVVSYVEGTTGTATATVTVTGPPIVPPITSSVTAVCQNASTTMTDGTTGGTWSSENIAVASVNAATGSVTGISGGTTNISYTITSSCGSGTKTKAITVNPLPAVGAIGGNAGTCVGGSFILSDTTAGGAWSSSNEAVATVDGSGVVTGIATGTTTIQYAVTNTCGTSAASDNITISTTATVSAISGSTAAFCQGTSITFSDTTSGGTWSSSNNAVATVSTSGVVMGTGGGTTAINYTVSNVCGSVSASIPVTISGLPSIGSITGASTLCQGTTDSLTDTASGGTWSSTDTLVASVTGTGLVTGLSGGIDTIAYSATNACGTSSAIEVIGVTGSTAGIINGHTSVCVDSVIWLTDSLPGGIWTLSNADAEISSGILVGVTPGIDTVFYTITSSSCGSVSVAIEITIADCSATSVANVALSVSDFKVFPNPSAGIFTIDIPKTGNTANIYIIDLMGKMIKTTSVSTPQPIEASLDLSDLPAGNYFIKVTSGDKTYREKIAVIK